MSITVTSPCPRDLIIDQAMHEWPVWTCGVSRFPWTYTERETCLVLEGDVTVTSESGDAVRFGGGDLVVFAEGLSCTWKVHLPVRKHYRFG